MTEARARLRFARTGLRSYIFSGATSAACYAMLYAARAALSEEDQNAKTHRGTWNLFKEAFVDTGRFDSGLHERARAVQRTREQADYDALMVPREDAEKIVALAESFLEAVDELLAG
jgi:uncharacterized protein (UPF0332 family)